MKEIMFILGLLIGIVIGAVGWEHMLSPVAQLENATAQMYLDALKQGRIR